VFLARVPMHLPLDSPLPRECESGLPLLDVVEQRAVNAGVPVESRIERGRSLRHALQELARHETFDTMVVAAVDATEAGFHPTTSLAARTHRRRDHRDPRRGRIRLRPAALARGGCAAATSLPRFLTRSDSRSPSRCG